MLYAARFEYAADGSVAVPHRAERESARRVLARRFECDSDFIGASKSFDPLTDRDRITLPAGAGGSRRHEYAVDD